MKLLITLIAIVLGGLNKLVVGSQETIDSFDPAAVTITGMGTGCAKFR